MEPSRFKQRVYELVHSAKGDDKASRAVDIFIMSLVILNVVGFIALTMNSVEAKYGALFHIFYGISAAIFSVEYAARMWTCDLLERYRGFWGRIRYALRPMLLVDLICIFALVVPFMHSELAAIRILRLLKLIQYSELLGGFAKILRPKLDDLFVAFSMIFGLFVTSSTLIYFAERVVQPQHFSSIPSAMWWVIVTMTTVGYGDVYPVTVLGKLIGGFTAVLGVCLFALPTAIFGAAFLEEGQRRDAAKYAANSHDCQECSKKTK